MKTFALNQMLKTFDSKNMKEGVDESSPDFLLKTVLLSYLSNGHAMGLSCPEMGIAYAVGMKVGVAKDTVELEQAEYDVLKKLCDHGQITGQGGPQYLFNLIINQQAKNMIDEARDKTVIEQ